MCGEEGVVWHESAKCSITVRRSQDGPGPDMTMYTTEAKATQFKVCLSLPERRRSSDVNGEDGCPVFRNITPFPFKVNG